MRVRGIVAVSLLLPACWGPPEFFPESTRYERCGHTICAVGQTSRPKLIGNPFDLMGDNFISERALVPLNGVDPRDFRELENGWATDGSHVWCGGPRPLAPSAEWRPLGSGFYSASGVVYRNCRPVRRGAAAVMAASFTPMLCGIARSAGALFTIREQPDITYLVPLQIADPSTFEIGPNCDARDSRFEYTIRDGIPLDARRPGAVMTPLPCLYARADDAVYYHGRLMVGVNATSFEVLFEVLTPGECSCAVARDREHVFAAGRIIEGADAATFTLFEQIGRQGIFRDRASVYLCGRRLADAATFAAVQRRVRCDQRDSDHYFKNKDHVWVGGRVLFGADPLTFEFVEPDASKPCTVTSSYVRDSRAVWYRGDPVNGADPATFVVDANGVGSDRHGRYTGSALAIPVRR